MKVLLVVLNYFLVSSPTVNFVLSTAGISTESHLILCKKAIEDKQKKILLSEWNI